LLIRPIVNSLRSTSRSVGPRWLWAVADVRPGEAQCALALALVVFLLLTAYYVLKVAREPLILLGGGAEMKAYAAAAQSLLLVGVLKGHGELASRVGRMGLLTIVLSFFASNLVLFALALRAGWAIGVPFYLWVGVFSATVLVSFWSFANDVYRPEQGKRLFVIIGLGSSLGAVAGAALGHALSGLTGPGELMLGAAGILVVSLALLSWVHRCAPAALDGHEAAKPLGPESGWSLLFRDRYLLLIGALALLRNWVNSTGEYVLDRALIPAAAEAAQSTGISPTRFICEFKADYFGAVNVLGLMVQLFLASRALKYLGVGRSLLVLPAVSLLANFSMVFIPALALVRSVKMLENGVDYSLQNTANNALFLVASREAKYKAKAVIDAFLMRAGDALAASAIWAGTHFGWSPRLFATLDVVLCGVWVAVAWGIQRLHARRTEVRSSPAQAPALQPISAPAPRRLQAPIATPVPRWPPARIQATWARGRSRPRAAGPVVPSERSVMVSLRHGACQGAARPGAEGLKVELPPPRHEVRMAGIRWRLALVAVVSIVFLLPEPASAEDSSRPVQGRTPGFTGLESSQAGG
jgi:AAA family ATP:ADP antiporter